jgi:hypothetical protein
MIVVEVGVKTECKICGCHFICIVCPGIGETTLDLKFHFLGLSPAWLKTNF